MMVDRGDRLSLRCTKLVCRIKAAFVLRHTPPRPTGNTHPARTPMMATMAIKPGRLTVVPYLKCGAGGVQSLDEHSLPGCNQSKLLLILEWTHGPHGTEVMMQGRHARPRNFRQFL
jgi:hypothetical protein